MTENLNPTAEPDDTEGHGIKINYADAERDETDEAQGPVSKGFNGAERDEADDTEGHGYRPGG
jgi:hypothetical protein